VQVLTSYFEELEEESIRDNFVIIYELLDELMDFGYPQFTETQILQVPAHLTPSADRTALHAPSRPHGSCVGRNSSPKLGASWRQPRGHPWQ
jgi:AP-1 complex subunit mu